MSQRPRARTVLAFIVVIGATVALASAARGATCGCGDAGLPYAGIAATSSVAALLAGVAYAALANGDRYR